MTILALAPSLRLTDLTLRKRRRERRDSVTFAVDGTLARSRTRIPPALVFVSLSAATVGGGGGSTGGGGLGWTAITPAMPTPPGAPCTLQKNANRPGAGKPRDTRQPASEGGDGCSN